MYFTEGPNPSQIMPERLFQSQILSDLCD